MMGARNRPGRCRQQESGLENQANPCHSERSEESTIPKRV